MDLYLYYTIRESDVAIAQPRVRAVFQYLADAYGVSATLKRRQQTSNGLQTWMEIYSNVPSGFDRVIEQAATDHGVADLIHAGRHIEYFEDLPACA